MADGQYKFSIGLDDKQLSLDAKSAAKIFDQLVKEAQKAGVKIDEALNNPFEELMKNPPQLPPLNVPTNVPQATQQFKGLNIATQQLVRELPAATMGLNTFFLAISNNLPIFADQVKEATEANKELIAQGKPTTGVFKQIISSLFSWQTALLAGVTVLSMYGKEIGEWVKSLFKGKEAVDAMAEAQRQLHETRLEGTINAQEEATNLMLTVRAMQDSSNSMDDRRLAMQRLQSEYPSYFSNMSEEILLYGDLSGTINELVTNMYNMQRARTALDRLVKNRQTMEVLKGTAGYAEFVTANAKFNAIGRKERRTVLSYGQYKEGVAPEYSQYKTAQKDFLKNLENQGDQGAQIVETIKKQFDGDVDAYFKSMEAANLALEKDAKPLVDEANKAAQKRKADEAQRRQEEAARQARIAANSAKAKQDKLKTEQDKLVADAEDARTELTIANMKEGLVKELAEVNKRYDDKAALIAKREDELKKMQGGKLTDQQIADFKTLRELNEQERIEELDATNKAAEKRANEKSKANTAEQREAEKAWNEYLITYGTFQEKLLATTEKYAALIANAQNEGERKMYEAERDAILAQFEVEASAWAKDLVNKSVKELKVMAEGLQSAVDSLQAEYDAMDTSDTREAKDLLETINYLNAQIAQLKERLGEAEDAISQDNWTGATEVLQGISRNAQDAADALAPIDEVAASILSDFADAIDVVSGLTSAIKMLGTAATAVEGVFAIFTVAIQLMSKLIKVSAENAEAAREVTEALDNYRNALKALNEEAERASRNTIFGEDSFGLALTNLEVARERLTDLNRLYAQLQSKDWDMHNLGLGNAQYSKKQQDFIDSVNAKDAALVADMRTASQKFFGANKNIVTADLADFYNDNGKLDLERLKAWYELYGEYLSEEQKHIVNQLIEGWEVYYDSTEAATNYLKGIFGELGDDITKSMVDAFANGTDAAQAFKDSVSDIMRNFASDMVEAMYIAPLLEQAQADVEAIWNNETMSHEQKLAAIAARMAQLGRELNDTEDDINESLGYIDRAGKDNGLDIFDGADRQGATKGIAQASQDSIDELNGRATAIQGHTYSLAQGQKQLINDSAQALKHLAGIELNTAKLHDMERTMNRMAGDINQMAMRGVKMI